MMLWMFFWNLFWLVLLGVAVWALVRWLIHFPLHGNHPRSLPPEPSALEILRQRYARGDIDATTFEQMRERLERSREQHPLSGV